MIKRRDLLKASVGIACSSTVNILAKTVSDFSFLNCLGKNKKYSPNIILCMADDQGWGDMGYNGHPVLKTPNFDAMASEGLRFDLFYSAAPVCSPTRGSVLTGRHPNRFGCFTAGYPLRPQEITIAESLKTAGYITGHFGKWHLGSIFKDSPVNPGNSGFDEWVSAPNFFDNDPILSKNGIATQFKGESSMVTVDAAIDFIRRHAESDQPFFAVVWFGSPHRPLKAIEQDAEIYNDQPEQLQHYYGEITGMDRAVGKLRKELRTLNLHENTILWYCSDNGGLKGNNGIRGHKNEIYDGGLRVPSILEWPKRINAARTTDIPCNTSDIYPTIMELVGIKPSPKRPIDGISLASLIDKKMKVRSKPMGFWQYPAEVIRIASNNEMSVLIEAQKSGMKIEDKWLCVDANKNRKFPDDEFTGHSAWLDWPWKLHRIETEKNITLELYNLAVDQQENNDLSAQQPKRVKAMKSDLEQWMKSVVHSLNGVDYN